MPGPVVQLLQEQGPGPVMRDRLKLAPLQRDALLRVVLAAPRTGDGPDWSKLGLDGMDLDALVQPDELEAWLLEEPAPDRLRILASLFNPHDETGRTDQLLDTRGFLELARRHRRLLPALEALAGGDRNARLVELVREFEEAIVQELLVREPSARNSPLLDMVSDAGITRFIEGLAARGEGVAAPHELGRLKRGAPGAPEAYARVVAAVVKATPQRDADRLFFDLRHVPEAGIQEMLKVARGRDANFQRVATFAAISLGEGAARALAGLLGDNKRGRQAARWLALMGETGLRAAREALDAVADKKTKTAERLRENAEPLLKLPAAPVILPALVARSSTWNLDLERFRLPVPAEDEAESPPARPELEPLDGDTLVRLLEQGPLEAHALPAHQWADLLQVVVLEPRMRQPRQALERARQRRRLGQGEERGAMLRAIEAFDFGAAFGAVPVRPGLFDLLLGARAPLDLLLHGLASFASRPGPMTLGAVEQHFTAPLARFDHPEAEQLRLLAQHIELVHHHGIDRQEIERWPLLATAGAGALEGGPWRHPEPLSSFRLRARIRGADTVRVGIHEQVFLVVDVPGRRWRLEGLDLPGHKEGPALVLDEIVQVDVERFQRGMRLGVGGVVVGNAPQGYLFEGLPPGPGPVSLDASGRHQPELLTLRLTALVSELNAEEIFRLVGHGESSLVPSVEAAEDAPAAHALAVVASLDEDETTREQARRGLAQMGGAAEPWREALGIAVSNEPPPPFPITGFETAVERFAAWMRRRAKKGKKALELQRAEIEEGLEGLARHDPTQPEWSGRKAIAEPTLYLARPSSYRFGGLERPEDLFETASRLPCITTWNSGGTASQAGESGKWLIIQSDDLRQEQDDEWNEMGLVIAAWKVEEGIAIAFFSQGGDEVAEIMGLPGGWPARRRWQPMGRIWIGE